MVDTRPFRDPKVRLRLKTAAKTAIAVILCSLLIFIPNSSDVVPSVAIVLACCYSTITMHASVVGTIRNSTESLKGGFFGFIIAYILALISSNSWYHVACVFVVSFLFGIHDPFLARSIFTKLAMVDAFVIIYMPSYFASLAQGVPMYFVVVHCLSYAVAILVSVLIWPQLSSRQFMVEFHYCMELCRELFLVLSLKLDNEVIVHDQELEGDNVGLLKQKKRATEKHIRHLEDKYSKKLVRLGRLLKESKWETWNAEKNSQYDKMLEILERLLRQLVSTREALALGKFSKGLNSNFVSPMFPLLETLQASILSHLDKLVFPTIEGTPISPQSVFSQRFPVAASSSSVPLDPEDISHQLEQKYTEMVRNYEAENKSANPSSEITRMVFTMFGAVEFSQWLHQLEECIARLPPDDGKVRTAICKDFIKDIASCSPMTPFKWIIESILIFKSNITSLFKMDLKEIYTSPTLHFPLRFSLGVLVLSVILTSIPTHLTDRVPHYNASWPPITFIIAILPSLGATLRKCFHRITGTVLGAFVGAGFIKIILYCPKEFQILPYVALLFLYLVVTCYIQQIPKFAYSGLTFMIVILAQIYDQDSDWVLAAMRAAFITIGIVWVLIFSLIVFPNRSAGHFQSKLVECNNKIAVLFGLIMEKAVAAEMIENGTTEAIQDIKTSYQAMRVHLKEAKSELLPFRWQGFLLYDQAFSQIHSVYFSLAAILSIIGQGFSPSLYKEIVQPLAAYLSGLVQPVMISADRVSQAFKIQKEMQNEGDIGLVSIVQALQVLDDQYFLLRKRLLSQKSLGQLHPQLRQFYSFLFGIREFVREWKVLEESLFASFGLTLIGEDVFIVTDPGELAPPNTPSLKDSSANIQIPDLLPRIEKELAGLQSMTDSK
eukprot:Phypoly_transcript_00756.p1 GENE.Phypoly_transcript_00756~~Phypoly_transcript_00756.p1  ORF type:complete len:890 (-),score=71.36 Phypoly_transcript_00756:1341-4010(-)